MLIGSWPKSFRKVNNAFHRRNQSSVDTAVCFVLTYPLESDLCGGQRYPAFEQPGSVFWPRCIYFCKRTGFQKEWLPSSYAAIFFSISTLLNFVVQNDHSGCGGWSYQRKAGITSNSSCPLGNDSPSYLYGHLGNSCDFPSMVCA